MTKICPNCNTERGGKFCRSCGTKLVERWLECPNGHQYFWGEMFIEFCPQCGKEMETKEK